MAENIKVFVHGEIGSGKSTFIRALSEIDIVSGNRSEKTTTETESPNLDFGRITIEENKYLIYLFAYTGGRIFPRVEAVLNDAKQRLVFCLILNPTKPVIPQSNIFQQTKTMLEGIQNYNKPFLLAASKRKDSYSYSITELRQILELPENIPLLECDPVTDSASAKQVLVELFKPLPQDELVLAAIEKLNK